MLVKRIDIVRWESDAFRQAHTLWGIRGIPYVRVYDKKGALVTAENGGNFGAIDSAVKKALQ